MNRPIENRNATIFQKVVNFLHQDIKLLFSFWYCRIHLLLLWHNEKISRSAAIGWIDLVGCSLTLCILLSYCDGPIPHEVGTCLFFTGKFFKLNDSLLNLFPFAQARINEPMTGAFNVPYEVLYPAGKSQ